MNIHHVRSHPISPVGDGASRFQQGSDREFHLHHSLQIPGRIGYSFLACKKRRGWLVKWVEKASYDCLNKLFMISANERNYQIILTNRNLLAVVREPRLYILPHPFPKVLVPGEHHVLKDLPFYEVAHAALQTQAPCGHRPTTGSTVCLMTKKKKPVTQPTKQVSASPLASLLASAPSDSTANTPSMGTDPETEIELVMPCIIYEVEEKEDMVANLRAGFKERQHKCLSESIAVAPPSANKS
ncbi:hypothetical protein AAG906_033028 [Vitis piasezkii]